MLTIRRIAKGEANLYREVRLASLKDSPEAFSSTYAAALHRTSESWAEQADGCASGSDRCLFLALDGVKSLIKPVAVAALYRDQNNVEVGELFQLWVLPVYRGSGVTDKLIQAIVEWAKENRFQRIHAGVLDTNKRVIRFYEKNGFKISSPTSSSPDAGTLFIKQI